MSSYGSPPYDRTQDPSRGQGGSSAAPAGSNGSSGGSSGSTADVAKEQAAGVASDAQDAGKHVAGVAKDQAGDVVAEAKRQASDLLGQGRTQLKEQSTAGQQRAASGLSSLAGELRDLAEGKGGSGIATDLAHQASQRVDAVGTWLAEREPADLLREVQSFARRRPLAFLAIAAGTGLVAGRLTRGIAAASQDGSDASGQQAREPASQRATYRGADTSSDLRGEAAYDTADYSTDRFTDSSTGVVSGSSGSGSVGHRERHWNGERR